MDQAGYREDTHLCFLERHAELKRNQPAAAHNLYISAIFSCGLNL